MTQLQKKERTLLNEFAGITHADNITMLRAYGEPTWRKERHYKKIQKKAESANCYQKLTAKECVVLYGDGEDRRY